MFVYTPFRAKGRVLLMLALLASLWGLTACTSVKAKGQVIVSTDIGG